MCSMSANVFLKMRSLEPSRIGPLPWMTELLEALEHGKEAEIHRAHVERGDFRLEQGDRPQAFLDRHRRGAAGGDVDHAIRALLDDLEERREPLGRLVGASVGGIARVQMDDRRTRVGRADGGFGDLLRRDWQVRRHRRRVDRAGDGAGDNDFAFAHGPTPFLMFGLAPSRPAMAQSSGAAAPNSRRLRLRHGLLFRRFGRVPKQPHELVEGSRGEADDAGIGVA